MSAPWPTDGAADLAAADALLAAATRAGADAAEVIVAAETSLAVGVADGALEEAERSETREIGLRVLLGGRQATVAASDLAEARFAELAARAVAIAREAPEDPYAGLAGPEDRIPPPEHPDPRALDLMDPALPPEPAALEVAARAVEAAALGIGGVTRVDQASARWGAERIAVLATNGVSHRIQRTRSGLGCSVIAGEGLGRERDYAYESRAHRGDLPPPEEIGRRAGERAVAALAPRRPPSGACPVVFDERIAGSLIGHLLAAINGTAIARGASWLRDRLGLRVLPAGIDLAEDPHRPRGPASRLFDAEGVPTRRRNLVADGVLETWLLDLASARQLGLKTTGHARRGLTGPPRPGASNLALSQGPTDRDGLLAEMGRGLLVTSLIGSSINPTTGAYSRGASGFWVEGGAIAHPVNEITLAGSLPEMLARLRPANDADPHRAVSVPSLLVEGLTLGA